MDKYRLYFPYLFLGLIIVGAYYKFFLFGKIPFPGDLLVGSYSPWFDYYKIPVQNPLISDVFSQLILWKYLSIDIFKSGQWPLWNPYSFTGNPLLATYQSAVLYPLNILLLLPKYFGWGIFIFSQTLIAAMNMYLFLGLHVKSRLARLTGAIIFAFGGLMTTWIEQGIPVHGIIWLPLSLYLVEKFLLHFKFRYLLFLIGTLSLSVLAGHFQMMTYSFLIVLIYAAVKSASKNIRIFLLRFLPVAFSMLLAIILCAPQLLPSFELFQKSIRLTESYTNEFNFGLLPAQDFLKFFIADFFGNPVTRNYWGFLNYFETSGFVGSVVLPLLVFAFLFLRRNKTTIFFLSVFIISCVLTFQNPLSSSVYQLKIPLITASSASRMLFITIFSIAILSAMSINQILNSNEESKVFKATVYSLAVFIGIILGTILSRLYILIVTKNLIADISSESIAQAFLKDSNLFLDNIKTAMRNSILPTLITLALFATFFIPKKKQLLIVCSLLFVLLTFDLTRYFLKFNPFVSSNLIFPNVPVLDYLKKQPGFFRVGREHAEVFPPNTWMAYNLQSFEGYDPIYLNQYGKFMRFLNGGDIRSGDSSRYAEVTSNYSSPYLDAANTKYFITVLRDRYNQIPGDLLDYRFKGTGYKIVFKDKSSAILQNPNALERSYFAKNITTAATEKIEDRFMNDKNFDPRFTTLLSKDLQISSVTGSGKATITYYTPNLIRIKTNTSSEEVLVLADQYDEGWKAKIDEKKTNISPANLIFRGVKVPAGSHEVVFSYEPESFDIGLKTTIVTILFLGLGTLITIRTKNF